jgi:SAM-dependent methyltransferase
VSDKIKKQGMPGINVDEIMARVREEVARRKERGPVAADYKSTASEPARGASSINTSAIRLSISTAAVHAEVGTEVTPMLKFPKPLRGIAQLVGRIVLFFASFITFKQRNFNIVVVNTLRTIADSLDRAGSELSQTVENRIRPELEAMKNEAEVLRREQEKARNEEIQFREQLRGEQSMVLDQMRDQKRELLNLQVSLRTLIEGAGKRFPASFNREETKRLSKEEDHLLDAMYVAFEERHRGTREKIKERQRVYLPYMERAGAGKEETPILDIGCGRGEWLELLKENGFVAKGLDLNRVMIRQSEDLGLDVIEADAVDFLRIQKANTYGAITGFHIIEHLPFNTLIELFDECLRVLTPGGMVIFETPNPENLVVGACNFYQDPSHRRPLPPELMRFIAEQRGFREIEVLRLHKVKDLVYTGQEFVDEVLNRMNTEQDYAIIGYLS